MTTITNQRPVPQGERGEAAGNFGLLQVPQHLTLLTWRSLLVLLRTPSAIVPSILISAFFLLIYEASLSGAAGFLPDLTSDDYLAFILPVSIVSAALNGVAGQALVRDIESGYFDKLLLTPVNRLALITGPVLAGAVMVLVQTGVILSIGLLLGLDSATGVLGLAAVLAFALLIGVGFSGFTVAVALRSGNAAATQSASFIFFPLTFLSTTFVPKEYLSDWLQMAATLNPITYIFEAMRAILLDGWEAQPILDGLLAGAVLCAIPLVFALVSLRARVSRH